MENQEVLVKVEGLSKKFCKSLKKSLKYGMYDLIDNLRGKETSDALRPDEFWALKDINFELKRGECLGLIGHNGAGKSTLLKILNGLINPDHGKVTMRGRVGALIELGAGFNGVMTGRENIYNNGAILGFTRSEIDAKVDEIIDFAEIREFIDAPVRNYSSGMKVRLGFAVAAQMEPDILIIDEVLAVGDVGFRIKCFNRISELLQVCAVIIVSHSMPQIAKTTSKAMLLKNGSIKIVSKDIGKVIENYNQNFKSSSSNTIENGAIMTNIELNGNHISETIKPTIHFNDDLKVIMQFKFPKKQENLEGKYNLKFIISDKELKPVATTTSELFELNNDSTVCNAQLQVLKIRLFPSQYSISISLNKILHADTHQVKTLYYGQNIGYFNITDGPIITNHAVVILESNWLTN